MLTARRWSAQVARTTCTAGARALLVNVSRGSHGQLAAALRPHAAAMGSEAPRSAVRRADLESAWTVLRGTEFGVESAIWASMPRTATARARGGRRNLWLHLLRQDTCADPLRGWWSPGQAGPRAAASMGQQQAGCYSSAPPLRWPREMLRRAAAGDVGARRRDLDARKGIGSGLMGQKRLASARWLVGPRAACYSAFASGKKHLIWKNLPYYRYGPFSRPQNPKAAKG